MCAISHADKYWAMKFNGFIIITSEVTYTTNDGQRTSGQGTLFVFSMVTVVGRGKKYGITFHKYGAKRICYSIWNISMQRNETEYSSSHIKR